MSVRKREDTYSVRLPAGFRHVGSATARQMLAVLFAQRVPLVNDPGPGDEYLKLTLPRAQVHALQALAGGDAAGVALRRLVATFAGSSLPAQRPVRALLPALLRPRDNAQIVVPQKFSATISRDVSPRRASSEPPPWYGLGAEQWAREGPEAKSYILGMKPLGDIPAVIEHSPLSTLKSSSSAWSDFLRLALLYFLPIGLLLLFAVIFGGSNGSTPAAPGSRFPQWRPE